MSKTRHLIAFVIPLCASLAFAQDPGPRYTYLEAGYVDIELDDVNADGDGYAIGGSVAVSDAFHISGRYGDFDMDFGIDAQQFLLGLGYHHGLSDTLDLVAEGGYAEAEIDTRFGEFDDNGYYLGAGLRWMAAQQFELNGGVRYVDLDDSGDDTALLVGALFHLTPDLALGGGVEFSDDAEIYNVGVRLYLGAR